MLRGNSESEKETNKPARSGDEGNERAGVKRDRMTETQATSATTSAPPAEGNNDDTGSNRLFAKRLKHTGPDDERKLDNPVARAATELQIGPGRGKLDWDLLRGSWFWKLLRRLSHKLRSPVFDGCHPICL